jgi:hypothetical protein
MTPKKYRDMANACRERARESRALCDTDGFLSQGASDEMAERYEIAAKWLEHGKTHEFNCLFHGDREVCARQFDGQYGLVWIVAEEEEARFGRKFIPVGKKSRIQKELGLSERMERRPAGYSTKNGRFWRIDDRAEKEET